MHLPDIQEGAFCLDITVWIGGQEVIDAHVEQLKGSRF